MSQVFHQSLQQLQATGDFRSAYLTYIHQILIMAATKFSHRQTKNKDRIAWGRLMLHAVNTGNQLLKARDMETLHHRLEQLEARVHP